MRQRKCGWRWVVLALGLVLLQACATVPASGSLPQAEKAFNAGDFKAAFRQLLPLAAKGDAKAQYALGYLYFYGYGVTADQDTGLFWIEQAAAKHYPPALTALQQLRKSEKSEKRE